MWIDRRWAIILFAMSVLLNIFLIGVVAGHVWPGQRSGGQPGGQGVGIVPQAHVRALPVDERRLFGSTMNAHRDVIRDARKAQRVARAAVEADVAAADYDKAKVAADFATLRQANGNVQDAVNAGLTDALGTLSPTSRASLVDRGEAKAPPAKP